MVGGLPHNLEALISSPSTAIKQNKKRKKKNSPFVHLGMGVQSMRSWVQIPELQNETTSLHVQKLVVGCTHLS